MYKIIYWTFSKNAVMSMSLVLVMAEVKETSQDYSCTGDLHHVESEYAMKNPDCDHYWSYQDHVSIN